MKERLLQLISFAILVQFAASVNATQTCSVLDSKLQATYLADPNDCGQFLVCVHGVAVPMRCPNGLHWNRVVYTCDYPARAKCEILDAQEVQRKKVAAVAEMQPLPNDKIHSICVSAVAAGRTGEVQLAHPEDCTKFLICSNGRVWIFDCPKGLHWNAARSRCDHPILIKNFTTEREEIKTTSFEDFESTIATNKNETTEAGLQEEASRNKEHQRTTSARFVKTTSAIEELQRSTYIDTREPSTTNYNIDVVQWIPKLVNDVITNEPQVIHADISTTKAEEKSIMRVSEATSIDEPDTIQPKIDLTTEASKFLEWIPEFVNDVTTNEPQIIYSDISTIETEEKSIMGESENTSTDQQTKIQIKTKAETKQSQTNIDRSILEALVLLTNNFTSTSSNTEQTTERTTAEPMTISPQNSKTTMTNMKNIAIQIQKEQQKQEEYNRRVIYGEPSQIKKLKTFTANNSFPFFDLSAFDGEALSLPLSKTSIERLYSSSNRVNGQAAGAEMFRNPQEKNNIIRNSTNSSPSLTFDPYQPYKAVECRGIDNEERFVSSDFRKYFQCHKGFAYLLNCFDGYVFSADRKICVLSDGKF